MRRSAPIILVGFVSLCGLTVHRRMESRRAHDRFMELRRREFQYEHATAGHFPVTVEPLTAAEMRELGALSKRQDYLLGWDSGGG